MKLFFTFIISLISFMGLSAHTPADSLIRPSVVADGLFFDKSVTLKELSAKGMSFVSLQLPDDKPVMGIYYPEGHIMEESLKKKAIPADKVKYAGKLLHDYNGRRPLPVAPGIGVTVAKPFIPFEYSDTNNKIWNNDSIKGKICVINVWQSECGPCRAEMPILSEWKERFPDVVFLSASRHITEEILPIAEKHNFSWTHLQEASGIVALVRQQGFPLTIVVDKEGIVRYAKVGASEENQKQAVEIIEELVR